MALSQGTKLGPYEILSLIGAGGMGEVYRARDPRLNREVAIKVLPADRVGDEDRRRRFVQEAHAASALNHPHIVTIHEIESANRHDFIVMEYVRGKSLDALIPRHGMRLGEVLRIAIPVADALAAAHARGIIHRDLKPANVMVGADGAVKVLDFGLAKLSGSDDADDDHLTHTADRGLSAPGTIAGTAAYMSPEQATGGRVDARSDIFSFGALLYEMVTGQRAFAATSTADTLSAVIRAQPKAPTAVVAGLPSDLEKVILRCLRKDPERRFQHIDDVKVALQEIKEESESGSVPTPSTSRRQIGRRIAIAAVVFMAAVTGWLVWRPPEPKLSPPRLMPVTTLAGREDWPTFSPDGDQVAFQWTGENSDNTDIYVTIVGSTETHRLTTDPAVDYAPSWSPDGRQIAFQRETGSARRIYLISALGGADSKLSDFAVSSASRPAWTPDSRYVAVGRDPRTAGNDSAGIYLIPVQGGEPRAVTRPTHLSYDFSPAFSPDSRRLAYASCLRTGTELDSAVGWDSGCQVHLVGLDSTFTVTSPTRTLTSSPVASVNSLTWSRDGKSVIFSAVDGLFRVDVDAKLPPERIEMAGPNAAHPATVSSRYRLAFSNRVVEIHVYRFDPGRPSRPLVASSSWENDPQFSRDGRHIAFMSRRSGGLEIWVADADGTGAHQLTHSPGQWQGSPHWSADGRTIAFDAKASDGQWHIWTIDTAGGAPRQITRGAGNQNVPTWSRDGQWIYFSGADSEGRHRNIWRVPALGGTPEQVTHNGSGYLACELADGKSLLYQAKASDSALLLMPVGGGSSREVVPCAKTAAFDVSASGIFYVACDSEAGASLHVKDPVTGRDKVLGTLENFPSQPWPVSFAVSPDGTAILYLGLVRAVAT